MDIDSEIAYRLERVPGIRASLTELAGVVVDVAARWASARWEDEIRQEIERDPSRARQRSKGLPGLKLALAALRARAPALAAEYLAGLSLHEADDAELIKDVKVDTWRGEIQIPDPSSTRIDEGLSRLIGAIGPALGSAGLLTSQSAIQNGQYRFYLPRPPELNDAVQAYDTKLKELMFELAQLGMLRAEKSRREAAHLWDDA